VIVHVLFLSSLSGDLTIEISRFASIHIHTPGCTSFLFLFIYVSKDEGFIRCDCSFVAPLLQRTVVLSSEENHGLCSVLIHLDVLHVTLFLKEAPKNLSLRCIRLEKNNIIHKTEHTPEKKNENTKITVH
jgi:hypothetical protein